MATARSPPAAGSAFFELYALTQSHPVGGTVGLRELEAYQAAEKLRLEAQELETAQWRAEHPDEFAAQQRFRSSRDLVRQCVVEHLFSSEQNPRVIAPPGKDLSMLVPGSDVYDAELYDKFLACGFQFVKSSKYNGLVVRYVKAACDDAGLLVVKGGDSIMHTHRVAYEKWRENRLSVFMPVIMKAARDIRSKGYSQQPCLVEDVELTQFMNATLASMPFDYFGIPAFFSVSIYEKQDDSVINGKMMYKLVSTIRRWQAPNS